ncbi:DNA adenine methylase [Rothia sp. P7208]|uniref:DNA adenine methylase n=1 Tax=Rothia sp. P7208 TaxID=3402660 RepID=UPI003AD7401B
MATTSTIMEKAQVYKHTVSNRNHQGERDTLEKNKSVKPILKWVGGKRQLLDEIDKRIPKKYTMYVEPFVGGGAVLLNRQPQRARINDWNNELVNVYKVIRDNPDDIIEILRYHKEQNTILGSEWYYSIRGLDRTSHFKKLSPVERAARMIYLNKTCYNGLFRVNASGQLNVPYGQYKNPNIVNEIGIRALHSYLSQANIDIRQGDFSDSLKELPEGSFVYLDPPYMPVTATSSFTSYTQGGFDYNEQVRLRDECLKLRDQGIGFLESNSDCEAIRELYKDFTIETVYAKRAINSRSDKRGVVKEVLISG